MQKLDKSSLIFGTSFDSKISDQSGPIFAYFPGINIFAFFLCHVLAIIDFQCFPKTNYFLFHPFLDHFSC
eukprot:05885.XXX_18251_18460_1 [CDS] Oithona nana genome sequencing.